MLISCWFKFMSKSHLGICKYTWERHYRRKAKQHLILIVEMMFLW